MKPYAMIILTTSLTATSGVYASDRWEKEASDAWIDGKAEATLLLNTNLNSFDINTDVRDGVVILTGDVNSSVEKSLAEELVMNIDGVKSVQNNLVIINENIEEAVVSGLIDTKIASVVKTQLLAEPDVSGTDINVEVNNGIVTLLGRVQNSAEKDLAEEVAKKVSDVKEVVNNLKTSE
ncbi:BON domain-containing protein [Photobacterium atrarenae]|uniref:BON domain-containing protein n=1 Tax=Photobacterium atrarenae TaxID=865757 RepID=A0ABY5GNM8_9GAMM|nr:BON domain-containing protein [Photobacterium atrarenae]UTV30756.1 BON domain-containing protein [Photobacterium atrarenae]